MSKCHRFIAKWYFDYNFNVKVGFTSNSNKNNRVRDYASHGFYSFMTLLFQTNNERIVRDYEIFLQQKYGDLLDNQRLGGGRTGDPPYYIYVVSKSRPPFLYS